MERRVFLKTSCSICLAAAAGISMMDLFSSCSTASVYKTYITENKISIPSALFAQTDLQVIRPKNFGYDIALRKESNGNYLALLLRCTHAENPLMSTGNGFHCNLHGSKFDEKGDVTKGPAEYPLKKFAVETVSDNIIIHLN